MQELLSVIRSIARDVFVFHQDNTLVHRARNTVELLRRETPQFVSPHMWPAISPDLDPVDYCIWGMMQERVYQVPICDTDEFRPRLIETWANFQQSVVDDANDQWRKNWKRVSIQKVITSIRCCDVACLTFKSPHNTTGSLKSHQQFEGNNISSIR